MTSTNKVWLILSVLVIVGLLLLIAISSLFSLSFGRGTLAEAKINHGKVWLYDEGSFDLTLKLYVSRDGVTRSRYVIDKSEYGTLRLIRHEGDVLAAADEFIFAAYDTELDAIITYHDLPFTIWEGQGEVVDSYKWSDAAVMRRGFPERKARE